MPHEITDTEFNNYVRMFKTYDVDGSGTIDNSELAEVMRCLGVTLSKDQLADLMRCVDVDDSGEIEFNEFLLLMVMHKESQAFRILQKSEQTLEHVKAAMSSKYLLPDERWRWGYDLVLAFAIIFYSGHCIFALTVQLDCGENDSCFPPRSVLYTEAVWSVLFIADVLLGFRTAYLDANGVQLVEDGGMICAHYLHTAFVTDLIAALPLDFFGYALDNEILYVMLLSLRFFKVFRLPRLFSTTPRGTMDAKYVTFYFKLIPMLKQTIIMFFVIHVLTCLWLRVQGSSRGSYVRALYLVMYTLTTVGYGDIDIDGDTQRLFACLLFLTGLVINAFVVGKMAATLQKGDIKSERKARMTETLAVLEHFEIPLVLQCEILAFQHHILEHDLSSSYSEVVASLPASMQDSLGLYIRVKFVMMVPLFRTIDQQEVHVALAQSLKNIVVAPEEFIIVKGEEGKEMFFLGHGFADVISAAGVWITTVKKGYFIGEKALLAEDSCIRSVSVRALTYCDLFRLDRQDFDSIVRRFPAFRERVAEEARRMRDLDDRPRSVDVADAVGSAADTETVDRTTGTPLTEDPDYDIPSMPYQPAPSPLRHGEEVTAVEKAVEALFRNEDLAHFHNGTSGRFEHQVCLPGGKSVWLTLSAQQPSSAAAGGGGAGTQLASMLQSYHTGPPSRNNTADFSDGSATKLPPGRNAPLRGREVVVRPACPAAAPVPRAAEETRDRLSPRGKPPQRTFVVPHDTPPSHPHSKNAISQSPGSAGDQAGLGVPPVPPIPMVGKLHLAGEPRQSQGSATSDSAAAQLLLPQSIGQKGTRRTSRVARVRGRKYLLGRGGWWRWAERRFQRAVANSNVLVATGRRIESTLDELRGALQLGSASNSPAMPQRGLSLAVPAGGSLPDLHDDHRVSFSTAGGYLGSMARIDEERRQSNVSHLSRASNLSSMSFSQMTYNAAKSGVVVGAPRIGIGGRQSVASRASIASRSVVRGAGRVTVAPMRRNPRPPVPRPLAGGDGLPGRPDGAGSHVMADLEGDVSDALLH
eukprot:TRINITY_DN3567_c0_g1_i1.p1 TRINITY_DN3567_c0_g1~~TRINITY_DN3567_c0_g1_i1.p1  ORF type:complete len:1036 (+),score=269.71 TRINITY_DN3567_c0_g1_i1:148-3255(+)